VEESGSGGPSSGTRYSNVAEALKAAIADGDYPVGTRLPAEANLCLQFGVSRSTVRQALAELETAGYVKRRQGSGTTVVADTPPVRFSLSIRSQADVLRYASNTAFEIAEFGTSVSTTDARRLHLGLPSAWRAWRGIRRVAAGDQPLGIGTVYVPVVYLHAMKALERQLPQNMIFGPAAAHGLVVTAIEQDITAAMLDDDETELLGTPTGTAALAIVRRYFSDERIIEVAETIYPSDRFTYELRLDRNS
jgi:GntR family transcriptional regulator